MPLRALLSSWLGLMLLASPLRAQALFGDADHDGDVDLRNLAAFQAPTSGISLALGPGE